MEQHSHAAAPALVDGASDTEYTAKLARRVQEQARQLLQTHEHVRVLYTYKDLCEQHGLSLDGMRVTKLTSPGRGRPERLPSRAVSELAQHRREYEDLLARYHSLETHCARGRDKLAESNRALRDLRAAVELREKEHLAVQRRLDHAMKQLTTAKTENKAAGEYADKLRRKFAASSEGTTLLKKNAALQKRLEQMELEKAQIAQALQSHAEEESHRHDYVSHLRQALDMKVAELGLAAGQSDVLEELVRLRSNYRAALQEVVLYEGKVAAQQRIEEELREQMEEHRVRAESLFQQQLVREEQSRSTDASLQSAQGAVAKLQNKVDILETQKVHLVAFIEQNMKKHEELETELQTAHERLDVADQHVDLEKRLRQQQELLQARCHSQQQEIDRLKGVLSPLEAEMRSYQLEVSELSQHLEAKASEIADCTAIQAELMDALRTAQSEKRQLQSRLDADALARTQSGLDHIQLQAEYDNVCAQLAETGPRASELMRLRARARSIPTLLHPTEKLRR